MSLMSYTERCPLLRLVQSINGSSTVHLFTYFLNKYDTVQVSYNITQLYRREKNKIAKLVRLIVRNI